MTSENTISRRGLFMKLGILFNGLVATALTVPIVRFLLSSVTQGRASAYLSWVRRVEGEQFQVFAINCAHLGCPVRWFPQSGLFMCPCHGGAYYRDGSRASGPPERGLFEYPYKVQNGMVTIQAGELPTPGSPTASLLGNKAPCGARNELVSIESKLSASSGTNALLGKTKTWA